MKIQCDLLNKIVESVRQSNTKSISLMNGLSGDVLFLNYIQNIDNRNISQFTNIISEKVQNIINVLVNSNSRIPVSYSNGIAGLGWVMTHVNISQYSDYDIEDLLCQFDAILEQSFYNSIKNKNYDYLHGILGYILFFLKRKNHSSDFYTHLIEYLEQTAIISDNKLKWISKEPYIKPSLSIYNISLSHGSASIIAILIKLLELKIVDENIVEKLIIGAVNYILSLEMDVAKYESFFPSFMNEIEHTTELKKSRLGWCYGDLGIGVTLWRAGMTLNINEWIEKSLNILLYAANQRRNLENNYVTNYGFCHGTVGIGHIFYRMWKNTSIIDFKKAADFWFKQTVAMLKMNTIDGELNMSNIDVSLITGLSGVGLALASYSENINPSWDEVFLLS
jgi:lantibiotic modifying enzyme